MTDAFKAFDTIGATGNLVLIILVIGIGYVVYVAPAQLLRGEAETTPQGVAGAIGLAFWGIIAVELVGLQP